MSNESNDEFQGYCKSLDAKNREVFAACVNTMSRGGALRGNPTIAYARRLEEADTLVVTIGKRHAIINVHMNSIEATAKCLFEFLNDGECSGFMGWYADVPSGIRMAA